MSVARQLLRRSSFKLFLFLDRFGLHVLPKHYYTPIADHAWLRENIPLWARRTDLTQVEWNLDEQVQWLSMICEPYYAEVSGLRAYREAANFGWGPGYGPIESQVLHCFIRSGRPSRIVEVGSGVSTACALKAMELNAEEDGRDSPMLTCIEPHPRPALESLAGIVLERKLLQETESCLFDQLGPGDLLFIDSSHAVKVGSDVLMLLLEIVPRLRRGVVIHMHDIYLPYIYPRDVLENYFGWQETALLLALLKGNSHLRVLCCLSAVHYDRTEALHRILADYSPQNEIYGIRMGKASSERFFPSSIWLLTT